MSLRLSAAPSISHNSIRALLLAAFTANCTPPAHIPSAHIPPTCETTTQVMPAQASHSQEAVSESVQLHLSLEEAHALKNLLSLIDSNRTQYIDSSITLELTRELRTYLNEQEMAQNYPQAMGETSVLEGNEYGHTQIRIERAHSNSVNDFRASIMLPRTTIEALRNFLMAYIASDLQALPQPNRDVLLSWDQAACFTSNTDINRDRYDTESASRFTRDCFGSDMVSTLNTFVHIQPRLRNQFLSLFSRLTEYVSPTAGDVTHIPLHIANAIMIAGQTPGVRYQPSAQHFSQEQLTVLYTEIGALIAQAQTAANVPSSLSMDRNAEVSTPLFWDANHLTLDEIGVLKNILQAFVIGNSVSEITVPSYQVAQPAPRQAHRSWPVLAGYWSLPANQRLYILYAIAALDRLETRVIETQVRSSHK